MYQPAQPGYDIVLDTYFDPMRQTPKEDAVVRFMKDLGDYYQLSPDKHLVFLPFPKRKFVHHLYMDEATDDEKCHPQFFYGCVADKPIDIPHQAPETPAVCAV